MELLTGVLLFTIGLLIGRGYGISVATLKIADNSRKPLPLPKKLCSCDHEYSKHHPQTKQCNVVDVFWEQSTGKVLQRLHCPCLNYDGPLPYSVVVPDEFPELL